MSGERILIVDDERAIAELIRDYLERDGFRTSMAFDGGQALSVFKTFKPDLALLDIMLPSVDGQELCRILRSESDVPIVMLSARKDDLDKILSLGLGADDYITKPFSPGELVARVKAHLRRYNGVRRGVGARLVYHNLSIDLDGRMVYVNGNQIALSTKEFDLLSFLARRPGQVFTKDQLFEQVWGENRFGDVKTVTVHVQKIRDKIGENPARPTYIHTVWGVGYRFDAIL